MTQTDQDSQRCVVPDHDEPRLADPGLLVCRHHHQEGLRLLLELPDWDAALRLALKAIRSPQAPKPDGGHSTDAPAAISSDVTAVRQILHMRLANLCATVALERKFHHPRNDVESMVVFLASSAEWMSRSKRFADGWYLAVSELAGHAKQAAYRARAAGNYLGPCPMTVAKNGEQTICGAPVRYDQVRYAEDPTYQPECPACKTSDTISGWVRKIVGSADVAERMTADRLASWLSWRLAPESYVKYHRVRTIPSATVRGWKAQGALTEVGRDSRNRPLYDRAAAEKLARKVYMLKEAS